KTRGTPPSRRAIRVQRSAAALDGSCLGEKPTAGGSRLSFLLARLDCSLPAEERRTAAPHGFALIDGRFGTASIRPERNRPMRSQRTASAGSCVTSTRVAPRCL